MKKAFFVLPFLLLVYAQSIISAPEPKPETIEIVIKLEKNPDMPDNPEHKPRWESMVNTVFDAARKCQECTERTFDVMMQKICACVEEMGATMKMHPDVAGSISITLTDPENGGGVVGSIRKK